MPHLATDTRSPSPAIVFTFPGIGVQYPRIRVQHPRNPCSSSRNSCSRSPGIGVQDRPEYADTNISRTTAVGCFPGGVSPFGVEELSGNVWEWTRSLQSHYPYGPSQKREDLAISDDVPRMLRGGSFDSGGGGVRAALRYGSRPDGRGDGSGFRVVVSPFSP